MNRRRAPGALVAPHESTKDLMARMGHDDVRAALIYQRATSESDRLIADRLSALVDAHRGCGDQSGDDGPAGV